MGEQWRRAERPEKSLQRNVASAADFAGTPPIRRIFV
jgi:hypothetical protein